MSLKETVNTKYSNLCAELGDVTYKLSVLQARHTNLVTTINQFEASAKQLLDQEQASQQALAQAALQAQGTHERPAAQKED